MIFKTWQKALELTMSPPGRAYGMENMPSRTEPPKFIWGKSPEDGNLHQWAVIEYKPLRDIRYLKQHEIEQRIDSWLEWWNKSSGTEMLFIPANNDHYWVLVR